MAALSDSQGIHKITLTSIKRIEITNQVTIREAQTDTMADTTEEDTTQATTKGCKTRAVTTQGTAREGDTSTSTGKPEVAQKRTSGLNL